MAEAQKVPEATAEAKAKAKAPKAVKVPKEKKEPNVRRSKFEELYPEDAALKLNAVKNPKKEGSKAHARFEFYTGAKTVADYLVKGGTYQDIAYDVGRQFITVTPK